MRDAAQRQGKPIPVRTWGVCCRTGPALVMGVSPARPGPQTALHRPFPPCHTRTRSPPHPRGHPWGPRCSCWAPSSGSHGMRMWAAAPRCSCLPILKANTPGVPLTHSGLGQADFLGALALGHLLGTPYPDMWAPLGLSKGRRKALPIPSDPSKDLQNVLASLAEDAGEWCWLLQRMYNAKKPAWTRAKRTKVLLIGVHVGK